MSIMIAYRPTPEGNAALRVATAEAKQRGETLLVMRHIVVRENETDVLRHQEEVTRQLAELEAELRADGVECTTEWTIGPRKASDAILEVAKRERPAIIVIGIRHRSPVGKLVMGSDAQEVLLHADVPVLAVKAVDTE